MASGGDLPFFNPFSFQYQGDIPGLQVEENNLPFNIPDDLPQLNGLYKECSDGKVGTSRAGKDFYVYKSMKSTPPLQVFEGYDKKKFQGVSMVYYHKLEGSKGGFENFIKEATLLETLGHVNVHKFYGILYGVELDRCFLVMNHFECYLSQLIKAGNELLFQTDVVKCIMYQIFNGLTYLHEEGVVHRDLTPENICFTEKGIAKISNFRSARRIHQTSIPVLTLNFSYQPVDMLLGSKENNEQVDVWSASCIFAELIIRRKLFKKPGREGALNGILSILGFPTRSLWPEFFELPDFKHLKYDAVHSFNCLKIHFKRNKCNVSSTCLELLQSGLIYNPEHRCTAKKFLDDPYFLEKPMACLPKFLVRVLDRKALTYPVTY